MRVVRKFDLSTIADYHLDTAHRIGQTYVTRPLTEAEKQLIIDRAVSYLTDAVNVFGSSGDRFYGFKYVVSDEPVNPLLDDKIFKKHRVVNEGFQKLKSQGSIVMAPYRVDNVTVHPTYGSELRNARDPRREIVQPRSFNKDPWGTIKFDDEWESANFGALLFSMESSEYDEYLYSPADLGFDLSAKHFLGVFDSLRTLDSTMVTSALAGANAGKMDLLTTLAEMPETVRSVLEGFRAVAKLSLDAKRKEFSLTKSSAKKRKALEEDLERRLAEINNARLGADKHRRNLLANHERKIRRLHRRNLEQLLKELNDGLASVWMNFRYNIMPNVYAVDDAIEFIAALYSEYDSSRARDSFESPITGLPDGWKSVTSPDWVVAHRCLVKSRYAINQDLSARVLSHGSANIAKTIWELGTRTFVIDWFLNVGDYLIALLGIDMSEERKTSYSWHINQTLAFVHEKTDAKVFVTINNYERQIINPYDCISLTVSNNLNLFRLIDSVAMLWPPIKRLLSSSK